MIDSCRYILQLFDRDLVIKKVVITKTPLTIQTSFIKKIKNWFSPSTNLLETILPEEENIESRSYDQQQHKKFYDETKQSIEIVLPALLNIEQQELSKQEHHKQEALE